MPAAVAVVISGVDRLTAVLDKITAKVEASNKRWEAVKDPFRRVQTSLGKLNSAAGLGRVGKSFRDIAVSARDAFGKVSQIVAPLGAITGAASLAGMYRMVSVWSDWGSKLGFAAQNMGISASALGNLQGAARLTGSSAGALTSGLQTLGQTMYDAIGGRAPEAVVMFNTLGISFRDARGHARSVADVMPEVADRIASIRDPFTQARVATELFGSAGADLLPFLRRGSAGIRDYQAAAAKYAPITQQSIDAANSFREAQARLTLSVEGLGNRISTGLSPVLSPLLTQLADWIATSPAVQTGIDDLVGAVGELGSWIKSVNWKRVGDDLYRWGSAAKSIVDAVGGIKVVLEGVAIAMGATFALSMIAPWLSLATAIGGVGAALGLLLPAAGLAAIAVAAVFAAKAAKRFDPDGAEGAWVDRNIPGASFLDNAASYIGAGPSYARQREIEAQQHASSPASSYRPSSAEQSRMAQEATSYFMTRGWTRAQAAGISANLQQESGFNAQAVGDGGRALGLGQWHADRQREIEAHFGKALKDMSRREQYDAVNYELREGGEQRAGRRLALARDAYESGAVVSQFYERPGAVEPEMERRGTMASKIAGAPSMQAAGPAMQVPDTATSTPQRNDGSVNLRVTHVGAQPEGFRMDVTGTGGNLVNAQIAQANVMGNLP